MKLKFYQLFFCCIFYLCTIDAGNIIQTIESDKACYAPGDEVTFTLRLNSTSPSWRLNICYRQLFNIISTHLLTASAATLSWHWRVPDKDFQGYLLEVTLMSDTTILDQTTIAVDVSSDWSRFPRYGFLSKFPLLNPGEIENVISQLNRYHINGLQFYDWHYKHHLPLRGTPENPAQSWLDIANRTNYFSTVEGYIQTAHQYNMKTMAYNLLYGALENAAQDGVSEAWCLYTDAGRSRKDFLDLSFWGHYIYIMDPHNPGWKSYILSEMHKVFQALEFDGWHIDQLGDRGDRWNYQGEPVVIKDAFKTYITEAKNTLNVPLVMNAVNQYGQETIAQSPVDFLYTEVWSPNTTFEALARVLTDNQNYSNGSLNSVLAAYVNYDLSDSPGWFNTPAVLMADAVIFAFGGAHLELGEHMLGHEYFPNNNLRMSDELKQSLIHYYDFLVAYQALLCSGGTLADHALTTSGTVRLNQWPPVRGAVAVTAKMAGTRRVYHLHNFVNASTLDWRDNGGTQHEPSVIQDLPLAFESGKEVVKLWYASPDFENGAPADLAFVQQDNAVAFNLPQLKYWDMIVVEYESSQPPPSGDAKGPCKDIFMLENNFPNPARQTTTIHYTLYTATRVTVKINNLLGQAVKTFINKEQPAGTYLLDLNTAGLASGLYFYTLQTPTCRQTKKMVIMH
jgi:dextranase